MEKPDRKRLTLAQVVSWIAWGRSFPCTTFRHAFDAVHEQHSLQADAALAELQAAAGGFDYGTSLEDQLTAAETALFDAVRSGCMTCYAKVDEREEAWQRVPAEWFSPDNADARPLVAALDSDWISREGFPPLYQILGFFARANPNGWTAVQFEQGEMHTEFLPAAATRWPTSVPTGVEAAPETNAVLSDRPSETPRRGQSSPPPARRGKGGKGPSRQVLAAVGQLGAKLAAEGAPEPNDGGQARLEGWFTEQVASLSGEISVGRARVHVRRAIKRHREAVAKDR